MTDERRCGMRPISEILSDRRHIYSDRLEIGNDGIMGYMTVDRIDMTFVASWGGGWEHISVSPLKHKITPSWDVMCKVKDIFFREDEAVIQIHPPKSEYVNNRPNCLHLWRPIDQELVLPPSFMVGLKDGETLEDIKKNIDDYYKERGEEK